MAALFGATVPQPCNTGEEIVPGWPGVVVREDSTGRILQSMIWGFPLPQKSKRTGLPIKPLPVNNVRDLMKPMWRAIAPKPHSRCLIPMTQFAEAEGVKGSKTRTWFRVKGQGVFAWAGFWRESAEWGPVYTGLMRDCNEAIRPVHDRMPVLVMPDEYGRWLHGDLGDVEGFQSRCFPDDLIVMERTNEPWLKPKAAGALLGQTTML